MIKDTMDKKFGHTWHVIVGKGFSYDITYEVRLLKTMASLIYNRRCRCITF